MPTDVGTEEQKTHVDDVCGRVRLLSVGFSTAPQGNRFSSTAIAAGRRHLVALPGRDGRRSAITGLRCLDIPDLDIALAIINVLAGIALGLRYRVVILVPTLSLVMTFTVIVGIARADHIGSIVLTMVIVGTAVQLGYLVGIAIRAVVGSVILKQPNGASGNEPAAPSVKEKSELDETPRNGSDGPA